MKYLLPSIIIISLLSVNCGPKGATKEERKQAAMQYNKGMEIVNRKNHDKKDLQIAYQYFENARIGYHDDERVLARINLYQGYIRYKFGQYAQALNKLRNAIKLHKRLKTPYIFVARIYILKRDYKSAVYWADAGIEKIKQPFELYYYKGVAFYRMKRYAEAESQYQKCIDEGAKGNYLLNAKSMINEIKGFLRSGITYETTKLARYVKKSILTFENVAEIITQIIPVRTLVITKKPNADIPNDAYMLMRRTGIFNRNNFFRHKYISKADFAYILCNLIDYLTTKKFNVKEKYKENPGIPDLKQTHYAFAHVLYAIESNLMQLNDDGFFKTNKNLTGIECLNSVKKIKQRYYMK